jgi:choline dehydrogenase
MTWAGADASVQPIRAKEPELRERSEVKMTKPDYLIIGAGSAGCVLANCLSADGRSNVLLLEAGLEDDHPLIEMPKGVGKLFESRHHVWRIPTEAEPGSGVPREVWLRGRTLGGSSSVNGMMYFRGHPEDYEEWVRRGADGWGWRTMKRCFEEIENVNGAGKGPLPLSIIRRNTPLDRAFLEAGKQLGVPEVPDLNHEGQEGVGYSTHTIHKGKRVSAATAFLHPAKNRPNLRIETDVLVDKIVFDGVRAVGVIAMKGGRRVEYWAEREIILAAGGLASPQILQRSGVGPAKHLQALGIRVVVDSPKIGSNMLEHRALMMRYRLTKDVGDNREFRGLHLMGNVLRYYLNRGGPMSLAPYQCGAFVKTDPSLPRPDAQITMSPSTATLQHNGKVAIARSPEMSIFGFPLRSISQGSVMLQSVDPMDPPVIRPNFLTEHYDKEVTIRMFRMMRKWVGMPALAPLIAEELYPGRGKAETDDEIVELFRTRGQVTYHACGTVAMGGPDAPLDEKLRVRGTSGLRVIDGSAMPMMPSANTAAPIMAMAWRAAELVLEGRNN